MPKKSLLNPEPWNGDIEIPPDDPFPQCDEVSCKSDAEFYLPVNDADTCVYFRLCPVHWAKLDGGEEVELVDDATGHFYKLNFSKPADTLDPDA